MKLIASSGNLLKDNLEHDMPRFERTIRVKKFRQTQVIFFDKVIDTGFSLAQKLN